MSYFHEIQTVYHVVENPQMILLCDKGAHGVSARREKACMSLPQKAKGCTLKSHVLFIANSPAVASQTNPVRPVHMANTSQTAGGNWQGMPAQPKLQKALHAPPRNRKLTVPPTWTKRLEPLFICARHNTPRGSYAGTIHTARAYTGQALSQGVHNTIHIQQGHHISHTWHLKLNCM